MQSPAARGAQTWAAAATGSVGLHAALAWLLGAIELGAPASARLTPRLEVFLVPPQRLVESAPPAAELRPPLPSPASAEADEEDGPDTPGTAPPAPPAESPPPRAPVRRGRIDWDTEIARAVERTRSDAPRYRSFGFPDMADDARGRSADRRASRVTPGEIETSSWGEQRTMLGENCYESRYEPGSVLGEAHRFMNPFVVCMQGAPAEPRDDLFEDVRPADPR